MYALAGIYDPEAAAGDIEIGLQRMREVLEVPPLPLRAEIASDAGAGCLVLEQLSDVPQLRSARDQRHGVWLVLFGEVDLGEELRARLADVDRATSRDAHSCLRLYLQEGADFVRHLNGHFNLVIYHEAARRLLIASDPFGYRQLFLARCGRRLLFASEMKAILAVLEATPGVDGIGLLQVIRQGWPLGERTWLEPISVANPGTWYEVTPSTIHQRQYFRFRLRRGEQSTSLPRFIDGFADKLGGALRRATAEPGRIGIALSGGLDSRSLLLAAASNDRAVLTYTFGAEHSRDVRYAAELAGRAQVEHLHLKYQAGYLGALLSPIVWRTEALLPFSEATFTSLHFHPQLATRVDTLLYGHAGDALTGAHLPHGVWFLRSRDKLIERLFLRYSRVPDMLLQRIFNPSFYRRYAPELFESLRASFASIDQDQPADILDVWDMENRQRRGTFASSAVDRPRFGVRAPFLDRELVEHLRQARPRWRMQQLAYKRMIATAFPAMAAVPWSHTGARLQTHSLADLASQGSSYLARQLRHGWRRTSAHLDASHAFRDLAKDTREDLRLAQAIRGFAASSSFPDEVFDRAGFEDVVRRHWEGGETLTHLVSMLATFAGAYQLFLWQRPQRMPAAAIPSE